MLIVLDEPEDDKPKRETLKGDVETILTEQTFAVLSLFRCRVTTRCSDNLGQNYLKENRQRSM